MKKLLLLSLFIPLVSFGQTPITDANFDTAINTCLSTNPVVFIPPHCTKLHQIWYDVGL